MFKATQEAARADEDPVAAAEALDRVMRDTRAFSLHHADGGFACAIWHALDLFNNPNNRYTRFLTMVIKYRPGETEAGRLFTIKDAWVEDIAPSGSGVRENLLRCDERQRKQGNIGCAVVLIVYDGEIEQGVRGCLLR